MNRPIDDLPATVTFGSSSFSAAVTQATTGAAIEEGGFLPSRDIVLHVAITATTPAVKVGSKLTVTVAEVSTTYRAIAIERSQDRQEFIISCRSHRCYIDKKVAEEFLKTGDEDLIAYATEITDEAAESLSKKKKTRWLYLNGLTTLSDAAAESLSKYKGMLLLDGLTTLSDAAAESLSKLKGDLHLSGLTTLSDAAAESLSKHLSMHESGILGPDESLYLNGLTALSDAAAESLAKYRGVNLELNGLTELSGAAAESLAKRTRNLGLGGLTKLSDAAAESLSKYTGNLSLNGLTELSDAAAESLSKHKSEFLMATAGNLYLDSLTQLSDAAAQSLSKHQGDICGRPAEEWVKSLRKD